jgi:DNA-binding CsgD family transcriptional regulator
MPSLNNLKKHPSLLLHKDIAEICRPFFQRSDFCYLNVIRLYDDGRVLYLCDNRDWLQHYLINGFPSIGAFEQNPTLAQNEYVLWSSLGEQDPILIYTREIFSVPHGITLILPFPGGCDYFSFGTFKSDRAILGDICTQIDELKQFSKIFYDKTKRILHTHQKHALDLSIFAEQPTIIQPETKRLYLGAAYDYQHLTAKELECLNKLISGQTVPEIATALRVSVRTIEKHTENIKQKLRCKTQCELGYLAAKLGIEF